MYLKKIYLTFFQPFLSEKTFWYFLGAYKLRNGQFVLREGLNRKKHFAFSMYLDPIWVKYCESNNSIYVTQFLKFWRTLESKEKLYVVLIMFQSGHIILSITIFMCTIFFHRDLSDISIYNGSIFLWSQLLKFLIRHSAVFPLFFSLYLLTETCSYKPSSGISRWVLPPLCTSNSVGLC